MITYSIKTPSFIQRMVDHFPNRTPLALVPPRIDQTPVISEWTKLQFAHWIETVKLAFHVGDLVTLKQVPVVYNRIPIVYTIWDIAEVQHQISFDQDIREPICITVKTLAGVMLFKCPSVLRRLSAEECALVDLFNTESQER